MRSSTVSTVRFTAQRQSKCHLCFRFSTAKSLTVSNFGPSILAYLKVTCHFATSTFLPIQTSNLTIRSTIRTSSHLLLIVYLCDNSLF